jgi:hypothetical protein
MSPCETIRILSRGERPVAGLLHTCRLEAMGVEFYGEEAILACFRARPAPIDDKAAIFEGMGQIAVFNAGKALVGDVAEGGIARLWWLNAGHSLPNERGVSVAFDPDLAQSRGDVFFAPGDHPALTESARARVLAAGQALVACNVAPIVRSRAFAVRAFGTEERGVALFAVYRLSDVAGHSPGFAMAAASWDGDESHVVRDVAGEKQAAAARWTPRVAR